MATDTLINIYSQELVQKAFQKLQSQRVSGETQAQDLWTVIEGPELISREVLSEFLALSYLLASDRTEKGDILMGEFGGVVVTEGIQRMLAVSGPSLRKIATGLDAIKEYERSGDKSIIAQLEEYIETPLIYRDGITIINGNRNVANYDFTTSLYRGDVADAISTNLYLLLAASGYKVVSNKHLLNEQYVFGIPIDEALLKGLGSGDSREKKLSSIVGPIYSLTREDFIAGFHILYEGNTVKVRPVILDSDFEKNKDWIYGSGLEVTDSGIAYLGVSDGYGNPTAAFEPGTFLGKA